MKVFKLITGEEVIAREASEQESSYYLLKQPRVIMPTEQGVALIPYVMFSKEDSVGINTQHIVCIYTPNDQLEQGYRQQTSGIVTASSSDARNLHST